LKTVFRTSLFDRGQKNKNPEFTISSRHGTDHKSYHRQIKSTIPAGKTNSKIVNSTGATMLGLASFFSSIIVRVTSKPEIVPTKSHGYKVGQPFTILPPSNDDYEIVGFVIMVQDAAISSVQVRYRSARGEFFLSDPAGFIDYDVAITYGLRPGEHITQVHGTFQDKSLSYLSIVTNQRTQMFGRVVDCVEWSEIIVDGKSLIGLYGFATSCITSIGFYTKDTVNSYRAPMYDQLERMGPDGGWGVPFDIVPPDPNCVIYTIRAQIPRTPSLFGSIQIIYKNLYDGSITESAIIGNAGDRLTCSEHFMSDHEYISRVRGSYYNYISELILDTDMIQLKRGTSREFTFDFYKEGYEIVGLHGTTDSGLITSLGVYMRPIDERKIYMRMVLDLHKFLSSHIITDTDQGFRLLPPHIMYQILSIQISHHVQESFTSCITVTYREREFDSTHTFETRIHNVENNDMCVRVDLKEGERITELRGVMNGDLLAITDIITNERTVTVFESLSDPVSIKFRKYHELFGFTGIISGHGALKSLAVFTRRNLEISQDVMRGVANTIVSHKKYVNK
jgi:hypothetical protein